MKCDSCQEKATVFYTQVADGKLKKFVLCEACAQAKGITNPEGLLMAEELLGDAPQKTETTELAAFEPQDKCDGCGFTLENFRKVGRLGCPDCYRTFAQEINQRLPTMHKGLSHTGYIPEGLIKQQALRHELSNLTRQLETAVLEENYEEAAKIRDCIEELEKGEKAILS
ncbi:MAG: UvrB/UvrC motif-containing protein [Akkermansiaceae bacterium]|nr:UvrB/UvrC motif-containing protein [Akkermansiaceae bacterium]